MVDTEKAVEKTLRILSEEYNRVFCPDSVAPLCTEQSAICEITVNNEELRLSVRRARESRETLAESLARTVHQNDLDELRNGHLKERLLAEIDKDYAGRTASDVAELLDRHEA